MVKKKDVIANKWAYAIELEARLGITESNLLAVEERATSAGTQVAKTYKKFGDFLQEIAKGLANAYWLEFTTCKEKVARVFS